MHVGKEGLSDATIQAVEEALHTRELLKIRVLDAAPLDARATGHALTDSVQGMVLVQVIGHVIVLYRPFPKNPDIRIPA